MRKRKTLCSRAFAHARRRTHFCLMRAVRSAGVRPAVELHRAARNDQRRDNLDSGKRQCDAWQVPLPDLPGGLDVAQVGVKLLYAHDVIERSPRCSAGARHRIDQVFHLRLDHTLVSAATIPEKSSKSPASTARGCPSQAGTMPSTAMLVLVPRYAIRLISQHASTMAKPGRDVGMKLVAGMKSPKCRRHTWFTAGTSSMSAR